MEGFDPGGCITEFGRDSSGNIRGCTKDNCAKNNLTPRGQEDDKRAYSTKQMCDPYGQCDTALGRTAAWPDGVWPQGCTVPGCVPGAAVKSTAYLESVKDQCGTFEKNPPMALGAYSWQFDDPPLVGTAGALATCPPDVNAPGATSKTDFTVTLSCN